MFWYFGFNDKPLTMVHGHMEGVAKPVTTARGAESVNAKMWYPWI